MRSIYAVREIPKEIYKMMGEKPPQYLLEELYRDIIKEMLQRHIIGTTIDDTGKNIKVYAICKLKDFTVWEENNERF